VDASFASALDSVDPDRQRGPAATVDALEIAWRLRAWALVRGGEDDPLAKRAAQIQRRAVGRLAGYMHLTSATPGWAVLARAAPFARPEDTGAIGKPTDCPPEMHDLAMSVDGLDAEPQPVGGGVASCWDQYVSSTMDDVDKSGDPEMLSRALLALADRPHRAARARDTAMRVRHVVGFDTREDDEKSVAIPPQKLRDRAARATVYAGLLRAATLLKDATHVPALVASAAVQREPSGGFGSSGATRAVVRAILAATPSPDRRPMFARVVVDGAEKKLEVPPTGAFAFVLPENAKALTVSAPGIVARLERPGLRRWTRSPGDDVPSPLHAEISWPEARAGRTGVLRVVVKGDDHGSIVDVRLPLPPGVALAEKLPDVRQVQGVLAVRRAVEGPLPTVIEVPVRFGLGGGFTVPEGQVRYAFDAGPRGLVPARPLVVAPP
jgi:hypothetical protein